MRKDPAVFIEHILESTQNIENFTRGVTKVQFLKNKEKQSAVIREIEVIGKRLRISHPHLRSKKLISPGKTLRE